MWLEEQCTIPSYHRTLGTVPMVKSSGVRTPMSWEGIFHSCANWRLMSGVNHRWGWQSLRWSGVEQVTGNTGWGVVKGEVQKIRAERGVWGKRVSQTLLWLDPAVSKYRGEYQQRTCHRRAFQVSVESRRGGTSYLWPGTQDPHWFLLLKCR